MVFTLLDYAIADTSILLIWHGREARAPVLG